MFVDFLWENIMKYNYIFLTPGTEERLIMYAGLKDSKYSQMIALNTINPLRGNIIFKFLYSRKTFFLTSHKIKNRIMHFLLPKYKTHNYSFFESEIKQMIKNFGNDNKLCFIVSTSVFLVYRQNICEYIKEKFPDSKCVIYMVDVVSSYEIDAELIINSFDKCFSFDKSECKKYGFTYCLEPFSYYMPKQFLSIKPENDIAFIGKAKDRLADILSIYEKMREQNLKLDFYIFGVKKKDQKYSDDIHYNEFLSFNDFLIHTLNARCTLEVLQKDGSSPTTRFSMCMLYKRKLLTNCAELLNSEWDSIIKTCNVQVYNEINSIDFDWIKKHCEYDNQEYITLFSTDKMLESMDSCL